MESESLGSLAWMLKHNNTTKEGKVPYAYSTPINCLNGTRCLRCRQVLNTSSVHIANSVCCQSVCPLEVKDV